MDPEGLLAMQVEQSEKEVKQGVKWEPESGSPQLMTSPETSSQGLDSSEFGSEPQFFDNGSMHMRFGDDGVSSGNAGDLLGWTPSENKLFETALNLFAEEEDNRWEKVSGQVPGKTPEEVKRKYEQLLEDVRAIESGRVPVIAYGDHRPSASEEEMMRDDVGNGVEIGMPVSPGGTRKQLKLGQRSSEQERRKGIAWSEEEHRAEWLPVSGVPFGIHLDRGGGLPPPFSKHPSQVTSGLLFNYTSGVKLDPFVGRLFLLGLAKFGKGDWRSISRNFVVSRTPTQVASHAQKYFIRLNSISKDKRRNSIHDITSVNGQGGHGPSQRGISGHPPIAPNLHPGQNMYGHHMMMNPGHLRPMGPPMGVPVNHMGGPSHMQQYVTTGGHQ